MNRAPALLGAVVLVLAMPLGTRGARAGTEEFSTFDVEQQEEDDESLLDHLLSRPPRAWRAEWEHAAQGFRTEQGCLTSGQWLIHSDLKLETPLGARARFGLKLRQYEDDAASFNYVDFTFRFPTRFGTVGGLFRPLYDKSRQDFAVTWETGADSSALQIQAVFALEDMFNNLWEFRQSRVGNRSEPYLQHPYEPALRVASRHANWRAEVEGKYLTPSRRRIPGVNDIDPVRFTTLWGALGQALLEARALGLEWELRGGNQQAFSTDAIEGAPFGNAGDYRRSWSAETAVRRDVLEGLTAELRYLYQDRTQQYAPPAGPAAFRALDRLLEAELEWRARPTLTARFGGLYDRILVAQSGLRFAQSYGTRNESRGYIGLALRFGRVSVSGIEGIELDPEPYQVWFVHDKGFLQLQALF